MAVLYFYGSRICPSLVLQNQFSSILWTHFLTWTPSYSDRCKSCFSCTIWMSAFVGSVFAWGSHFGRCNWTIWACRPLSLLDFDFRRFTSEYVGIFRSGLIHTFDYHFSIFHQSRQDSVRLFLCAPSPELAALFFMLARLMKVHCVQKLILLGQLCFPFIIWLKL